MSRNSAMVRITITAEAWRRVYRECPSIAGASQKATGGNYFVWVYPETIRLLDRLRGPQDSYSDVFMRF